MNATIAAIATPLGRGAIGIIRVSGPKVRTVLKNIFPPGLKLEPHRLQPSWVMNGSTKIDQAMVVFMSAPNSFTGEDMAEIHTHGSRTIQHTVLDLLIEHGCQPAEAGEFSKRAYLNSKIDLTQAEAIMELVEAENQQLLRLATSQLAGQLSKKITNLKTELTGLAAAISAELDFSEEDLPGLTNQQIKTKLQAIQAQITQLLVGSQALPVLKEGLNVALVGLPNAGKSTLMNCLLGFDRSIVTEIAGTTRDTVEETISIKGISYHLIDTAGMNSNPSKVEQLGIKRSVNAVNQANIILLLVEPGKNQASLEYLSKNQLGGIIKDKRTIIVQTKTDLKTKPESVGVKISVALSAKKDQNIQVLLKVIAQKTALIYPSPQSLQVLTKRQSGLLTTTHQVIKNLLNGIESKPHDIIAAELLSTVNTLGELTGEQADQAMINAMFVGFCIGK